MSAMPIFSITEITFLGLLCVSFLVQLFWSMRYLHGVSRWTRRIKKNKVVFSTEKPPVSVIICARNEADNLQKFLPSVLEQDYPDFEVIVVNDSSEDNTDEILKLFKAKYAHLRSTFVPIGTRIISSKKLALSLGIKAASHEHILLTDADCCPMSKNWISSMIRNFTPETDIVLGYGAYFEEKSFLNKLITFDTLFIALQYLGMAYAKKPYMAVGRNLAYRKSVFLKNGGFARTLKFSAGDDDLFINRVANKTNIRIEASPESITHSTPKKTLKKWHSQKERHLSVAKQYSPISKFRLVLEPLTRALFYISMIALLVLGNWVSIIVLAALFIIRYAFQTIIINQGSKQLQTRRYYFTHLLFELYLPLVSLYILLFRRNRKQKW